MLNFRGVISDIDGVLINEGQPTNGAIKTISQLISKGIPLVFCSNNIRYTEEKLRYTLKIKNDYKIILLTPLHVIRKIIRKNNYESFYSLGDDLLRRELIKLGLSFNSKGKVDFVIVGSGMDLTYEGLKKATDYVLNGAKFYLTGKERFFKYKDEFFPSAGVLGKALEESTKVEPILVGKPGISIFNLCLSFFEDSNNIVVLGDDIETDIKGAQRIGLESFFITYKSNKSLNSYDLRNVSIISDVSEILKQKPQ